MVVQKPGFISLSTYCIWTIGVCLSPAVAAVALTTNQFWQQQQSYCRESIFGKQQFFLRLGCLITPTAVQFLPCSFIILYHTQPEWLSGKDAKIWFGFRLGFQKEHGVHGLSPTQNHAGFGDGGLGYNHAWTRVTGFGMILARVYALCRRMGWTVSREFTSYEYCSEKSVV